MERKFVQITRTIDPRTRIHYLDAIDDQGRHWMAEMSHHEESWLCYTRPWCISAQQLT
jgi:poly(3-hydroxyalkanoate) synthetase